MRCAGWLGLLVLAAPACGGGNGSPPFMPTTPVSDACGMLALADVQVLVPGAPDGTAMAPEDDANIWLRGCSWQAGGLALTLIVEGALTSTGDLVLGTEVEPSSSSTTQSMTVSGLGDKAVYLNNVGLDQILNAKQGSEVVSVGAYLPTVVPESSLEPLAVEALGHL